MTTRTTYGAADVALVHQWEGLTDARAETETTCELEFDARGSVTLTESVETHNQARFKNSSRVERRFTMSVEQLVRLFKQNGRSV